MTACGDSPERMPLIVDAVGDLRLCNHSPVVVGNIHRESFDEIFKKRYVSQFFATIPPLCSQCEAYARCRGGCKAVSEQLGIPLAEHDPLSSSIRVSGDLSHNLRVEPE